MKENDDSLAPGDDVDAMIRDINAELHRQRVLNRIDLVENGYEPLDEAYLQALRERERLRPQDHVLKLTPEIERAMRKADLLHAGQTRKSSGHKMPYMTHLLSVAEILARHGADETTLIAGLLHDTLEDTAYTGPELTREFGQTVHDIVVAVSEEADVMQDRKASWEDRKRSYLRALEKGNLRAWMVSSADKIHNLRSMVDAHKVVGDALWEKFNSPPDKKLWFYEEVYKIVSAHLNHSIVQEFKAELEHARAALGLPASV